MGAQCSAHGRKNCSHPKNTPFSLGRKPNNLKMFMKNPLHSLQVAKSTPENSRTKSLTSLPNLCLTKIKSEKKKIPQVIHLPKSAKNNGHCKNQPWQISHQKLEHIQLLKGPQKLGGLATVGPSKLFGAQHHPDEFGFLAEPPILEEVSVVG